MAKRAVEQDEDIFADDRDDVEIEEETESEPEMEAESEEEDEDAEIEQAAATVTKKSKPAPKEDAAEVPAPKAKSAKATKKVKVEKEDAEERPKSKGKEVKKTMASKGKTEKPHRSTAKNTVKRGPVLAGYFSKPKTLRATYHGKDLTAKVLPDGMIHFNGKTFTSPSGAGSSIRKGNSKVDGWLFWKIEDNKGNLISLDSVRQKKSA